ncbi:DUF3618 domain-containing protein [Streptomyces stramineus]|uniref:DUF3618 domain-containing protein n=1 Tax=Streptomyces stramineus TaxID=173861 RepID=A0ABN0ZWU4_9ACTN
MNNPPQGNEAAPTPQELRERVEHTREELGRTVEALAAKADVKARAQEKKAEIKEQAADKAAQVAEQVRETAARAGQLAADKTPEPVREKAGQAVTMARANRNPLLAVTAALAVFLLIRRSRRCR